MLKQRMMKIQRRVQVTLSQVRKDRKNISKRNRGKILKKKSRLKLKLHSIIIPALNGLNVPFKWQGYPVKP